MHGDTELPDPLPDDDLPSEDEPLLKREQVAKIMNISERTVSELARTKELPSFRIRGSRRFARSHVDAYLARALADDAPTLGEAHHESVSRPGRRRDKQSADA